MYWIPANLEVRETVYQTTLYEGRIEYFLTLEDDYWDTDDWESEECVEVISQDTPETDYLSDHELICPHCNSATSPPNAEWIEDQEGNEFEEEPEEDPIPVARSLEQIIIGVHSDRELRKNSG